MITKKLASSPMLYMSSGSKELFHSNFLYCLGTNYRDKFQILMTRLLSIASQWPDEWILHREFLHLDLCVTYKKEKEKKNSKGKKNTEECVFIIIENKVKSLPDIVQLKRYEQLFNGRQNGCHYAVLSLVKGFYGNEIINKKSTWKLHYYDELAKQIEDIFKGNDVKPEHITYIKDYCLYVHDLSKLANSWKVNDNEQFLQETTSLKELRLNDIYEKIRYAQVAAMLAQELENTLAPNANGEPKVVLGMSNADVILRRGRAVADKILSFYGCPNADIYSQVFISSGMSHGVGLMEAKVKVADDCCLVLQVQGNRYCHGIERQNIVHNSTSLSEWLQNFIEFKFGGLPYHKSQPDSKQCHYKDGFIYKSQKIDSSATVRNIVDALRNDIEIILETKPNTVLKNKTHHDTN